MIITRKIAGWGSSIFLIIFIALLTLGIKNSIKWLMLISIVFIVYSLGILIVLLIVLYDYYKYGE